MTQTMKDSSNMYTSMASNWDLSIREVAKSSLISVHHLLHCISSQNFGRSRELNFVTKDTIIKLKTFVSLLDDSMPSHSKRVRKGPLLNSTEVEPTQLMDYRDPIYCAIPSNHGLTIPLRNLCGSDLSKQSFTHNSSSSSVWRSKNDCSMLCSKRKHGVEERVLCHCSRRSKKVRIKRTVRVPAVSNKLADIPSDDFSWRKYGQKLIKGSPYPRSYYKCSHTRGCPARKHTELCLNEANMFIVTYEGDHNHQRVSLPIPGIPIPH